MTAPTTRDAALRMPPAALSADPCFEPVTRLPLPGSRNRIRVVELLATGTSGGAQEHVYNLVTRIDRSRYDVSVLSLSNGAAVRRLERTGISVCVLDDMTDEQRGGLRSSVGGRHAGAGVRSDGIGGRFDRGLGVHGSSWTDAHGLAAPQAARVFGRADSLPRAPGRAQLRGMASCAAWSTMRWAITRLSGPSRRRHPCHVRP